MHDLTDYSEDEILALKVQNGGKLCGSFRLAKPLSIGAGIASLALAACQPEPELLGEICPTEQSAAEEKIKPIKGLSAETQPPNKKVNHPTSTKPLKIAPPAIDRQVIPHEGMLLGKVAPQNPHAPSPLLIKGEVIQKPLAPEVPVKQHAPEQELLLGDVCLPEVNVIIPSDSA